MAASRTRRRRALTLGIVVGVVAGTAVGAALLAPAGAPSSSPSPEVLHAAPAVVPVGAEVTLSAATVCAAPGSDSCAVVGSVAHVLPEGSTEWAPVNGQAKGGGYLFRVPAALVPDSGFEYWLEFRTRDGSSVAYPPGGERSPIRVITTAGLAERSLPAFRWDEVRPPDGALLRLPYGEGDGRVGRAGTAPDELPQGPSSFDVGPDGSIYVVDWVNRRIQVFSPRGRFARSIPLPAARPMDLAVAQDGRLYLSTLGLDATAYEVSGTGRVLGRYPVAYGVAARVSSAPDGPRVMVGPSQWVPVRGAPGVPLPAESQAAMQTSSVPLADGSVGIAGDIGDRAFAVAWTRPDGSRVGAVFRLPPGVRVGTDYFVRPLADGGAVVARGLWDDTNFAVAVLRLDARADIVSFARLPEPSIQQDARFSTVRFRDPGEVLAVYATDRAVTIERYEVAS
ncbi:MAG: hypothetical protein HY240_10475 [Actinobacteria bacterium]|nr:hypothetical protein [Actinomycetota bacterium]